MHGKYPHEYLYLLIQFLLLLLQALTTTALLSMHVLEIWLMEHVVHGERQIQHFNLEYIITVIIKITSLCPPIPVTFGVNASTPNPYGSFSVFLIRYSKRTCTRVQLHLHQLHHGFPWWWCLPSFWIFLVTVRIWFYLLILLFSFLRALNSLL